MSLDSFENAALKHKRRMERDHHMEVIQQIADEFAGLDSMSSNGVEVLQPRESQRVSVLQIPRWKTLFFRLFALLMLSIVFAIALLYSGSKKDSSQSNKNVNENNQSSLVGHQKYSNLFSMILDWNVTPREHLLEPTRASYKALQWLAFDDEHGGTSEGIIRTRYALATFYFGTKAGAWNNRNHWMSAYSVCLWHGVQCVDTDLEVDFVKSINLTSNGLVGTIPEEVSLLGTDLDFLDVSRNSLHGAIPNLSSLEALKYLYLGPNDLSGTIPESLYQLTRLIQLYFEDAKLSGSISSSIGALSNLQELAMHTNFLTGDVPPSIENLSDLRVCYLDSNRLSGTIPSHIGSLGRVVDFRLGSNRLSGPIPVSISNMTLLQVLSLNNNRLSGAIPGVAFRKLVFLHELHLHDNDFHETIPSELGSLSLLSSLYLDQNHLEGSIPQELFGLKRLKSLFLFENRLTGQLPRALGENLRQLRVDNNRLTGMVPTFNSSSIETLFFNNNTLNGRIPNDFLANLEKLKHAQFHGNLLTGKINCDEAPVSLEEITADCYSQNMSCTCCTHCYSQ